MKQFNWKICLGGILVIFTLCFIFMNKSIPTETAGDGKWTRVNDTTIMLEGNISEGNFEAFKKVFDDKVKTVIINSGGGDTYEAVQIGLVLKNANVDVVVRGYCLSSAANYLFTAGKTKTIEDGIVGFHGNSIALTNEVGGVENLIPSDTPDRDKFIARIQKTLDLEKEFFQSQGISQRLFDITQTNDKGTGDGNTYEFLLPTSKTFAKYGITNVVGKQSKKWIKIFYEDAKKKGFPDAKLLIK